MANTKISELTSASAPLAGTETLPIVQSGATKQVSVSNLTAGRAVLAASLGLGNPANYSLTSYAPGANANYLQVVNGSTGAAAGNGTLFGVDASGNGTISAQGAVSLNINVAGLETFNLDSSNNAKFSRGNLIQGTAAKGINFTANTPAAGMTSQLLNWYEEGTWTPSGNGITFTSAGGTYLRVGKLVTVFYSVVFPTTSDTNQARLNNLPFTSTNTTATLQTGASDLALIIDGNTFARFANTSITAYKSNADLSELPLIGQINYSM